MLEYKHNTQNSHKGEKMTQDTLKARLNQTAKLRDTCKANGDHDGFLAHDKQISLLQHLLCKLVDSQSTLRINACQQLSR